MYLLSSNSYAQISLEKYDYSNLQNWQSDNHHEALSAFLNSCTTKIKLGKYEGIFGTKDDWLEACKNASTTKNAEQFFSDNFAPYLVKSGADDKGLFTGYYIPTIKGSFRKNEQFQYPLYKYPAKLPSIPSRKEISEGRLDAQDLELLYLQSPIERFFLHIQGSGNVILEDGSMIKVGFAGKNGLPYTSIGKILLQKGYISKDNSSADAIAQWLKNNPKQMQEIFNHNESYIFFKILTGNNIVGGQGVALTAQRSLAIDNNLIPYSVPIWLETEIPSPTGSNLTFNRLMVSQDTGSAIKGSVRGDIFFGSGDEAKYLAGNMKSQGKYYMLLPKKRHAQE